MSANTATETEPRNSGTGIEYDTSIEDARWLFAAVAALGLLVLSSGLIAAALGA